MNETKLKSFIRKAWSTRSPHHKSYTLEHGMGGSPGIPDVLFARGPFLHLVEFKMAKNPVRPSQKAFHRSFPGRIWYVVAENSAVVRLYRNPILTDPVFSGHIQEIPQALEAEFRDWEGCIHQNGEKEDPDG